MRSELVVARRAMACEFSATFPAGTRDAVAAGCAALDEVDRLEQLLSFFREDSEISRLNRDGGPADPEVYTLLLWAARLTAATGGAFDPVCGALTGSNYVRLHDGAVKFLRPGVQFNLGAIGKGFAIDSALRRLRPRTALMQGGRSSIRVIGSWTVEIGDPPFATVQLRDQAMGTSATTYQPRHILDPRTGRPARRLLSATAIAPTATEADALSTAFFVMGPVGTRRFCAANPRFAAVLLLNDKTVEVIDESVGQSVLSVAEDSRWVALPV
jgi:FAD:protein FMN transferase